MQTAGAGMLETDPGMLLVTGPGMLETMACWQPWHAGMLAPACWKLDPACWKLALACWRPWHAGNLGTDMLATPARQHDGMLATQASLQLALACWQLDPAC